MAWSIVFENSSPISRRQGGVSAVRPVPDEKFIERFGLIFGFREILGILPVVFEQGPAIMEERERNFNTLEKMCRERARMAEKEMHYWLAEAEEWARLKNCSGVLAEREAVQLDCFSELSG